MFILRTFFQDFFSETKFYETETKTLNKMAKVSKLRSFKTEMSHSEYSTKHSNVLHIHVENWTQQNDFVGNSLNKGILNVKHIET